MTRYPHRCNDADWLQEAARTMAPAALLRRLLPLSHAALPAAARLVLHRTLWQAWADCDEAGRAAARRSMDGRFARLCDWLARPWSDPLSWQRLALAHLAPQAAAALQGLPAMATAAGLPSAPAYVPMLLAAHGLPTDAGQAGTPTEASAQTHAHARWLALRARLESDDVAWPLDEAERGSAVALQAVQHGVATAGAARAVLFDLALRTGDADSACATLAQLIQDGHHAIVRPPTFLRWLEGSAETPLALMPAFEAGWLHVARLDEPGYRAQLRGTFSRPAVLARLQSLEALVGVGHAPARAGQPFSLASTTDAAAARSWRLLAALDRCLADGEAGALQPATAQGLIDSGGLAPAAVAALSRLMALQALDASALAAAMRALACARQTHGDAQARSWLAQVLELVDPEATGALVALLRAGSTGGDGGPEQAAWQTLATHAQPPLNTLARAMLARLAVHGRLEPGSLDRRQDLVAAHTLWQGLTDDPDHAEEARAQLASEPLTHWLPHLRRPAMREHLWIEPTAAPAAVGSEPGADRDGAPRLTLVMSCLDSRHSYTQVASLRRSLPDQHLLFVNNPEFNWYSDAAFEAVAHLIEREVLPRFERRHVTAYFGSMGGHGALKLALHFGFQAVVFNPQTDLDLWAAFRPRQRPRLWAAERHARLEDWPAEAWAAAPVYLAVGSSTVDRLAFSVLVERWRTLREGQLIVEKFADPAHAGLIKRIAGGPVPALLQRASTRLASLREAPQAPAGATEVAASAQAAFWQALDDAPRAKLEIVLRQGRLFHQPSVATGSVPA